MQWSSICALLLLLSNNFEYGDTFYAFNWKIREQAARGQAYTLHTLHMANWREQATEKGGIYGA